MQRPIQMELSQRRHRLRLQRARQLAWALADPSRCVHVSEDSRLLCLAKELLGSSLCTS